MMASVSEADRELARPLFQEYEEMRLCLWCRQTGHWMDSCPNDRVQKPLFGYGSTVMELAKRHGLDQSHDELCYRCRKLELLNWLREEPTLVEWNELRHWPKKDDRRDIFRSLGPVRELWLYLYCSVCRCLFTILPQPLSEPPQDAVLVKTWSLFHFEMDVHVETPDKRTSSLKLSAVLVPDDRYTVAQASSVHSDTLTISTKQWYKSDIAFVAREVGKQINYSQIEDWLTKCTTLHPSTCVQKRLPADLEIVLIDIDTRRLVKYSRFTSRYIALSYVWGEVSQEYPEAGKPGAKLGNIALTIEDAIKFTSGLGVRYLWVDSICIDQSNTVDKLNQIARMDDIYSCSYATIVAASGTSAESGLPRISWTLENPSQFKCVTEGIEMVSIGLSLHGVHTDHPWGERAWTLQEALLSPRCIYVSNFQIYFECNAMQMCETLDETHSAIHHEKRNQAPTSENHFKEFGRGRLRSPFVGAFDSPLLISKEYERLLTLYSSRRTRDKDDVINAFSGILRSFEQNFQIEFYWAQPIIDFVRFLLWRPNDPPHNTTRTNFPSWSWTTWAGQVTFPGQDMLFLLFNITVWRVKDDKATIISTLEHDPISQNQLPDDPFASEPDLENPHHYLTMVGHKEQHRIICIESFTVRFTPDTSVYIRRNLNAVYFEYYQMNIRGVPMIAKLYSRGQFCSGKITSEDTEFLIVSRDKLLNHINYDLIALRANGHDYERVELMSLIIPLDKLWVLKRMGLRRRQITLR